MSELLIRLPADADRRLTEAARRLALGRRQLARAILMAVLSDERDDSAGEDRTAGPADHTQDENTARRG